MQTAIVEFGHVELGLTRGSKRGFLGDFLGRLKPG